MGKWFFCSVTSFIACIYYCSCFDLFACASNGVIPWLELQVMSGSVMPYRSKAPYALATSISWNILILVKSDYVCNGWFLFR